MSKSKKFTISVLVLVIFTAAAYFAFRSEEKSGMERLVVNQAAQTLLYLPLYVAKEQGYFAEEGFDIAIVTGGGDSQAFSAMIGGSADVAQGDPMMAPIAWEKGNRSVIIGNVVAKVAFWGVALDESIEPIVAPQQFKGLRVVTYPAPMTIYALQRRNLRDGNLEEDAKTKIVQAQFGAELAPLFSGDADITMTLEPVVSTAVSQGAKVVYSFPEVYGDFALTGLTVPRSLVADDPEKLQRILNAYQKALSFCHSDQSGAVAVAQKVFADVDSAIVEQAVLRMLKEETIPKHAVTSSNAYENAAQVRKDIGDLAEVPSFENLVENRFALKAQSEYGLKVTE